MNMRAPNIPMSLFGLIDRCEVIHHIKEGKAGKGSREAAGRSFDGREGERHQGGGEMDEVDLMRKDMEIHNERIGGGKERLFEMKRKIIERRLAVKDHLKNRMKSLERFADYSGPLVYRFYRSRSKEHIKDNDAEWKMMLDGGKERINLEDLEKVESDVKMWEERKEKLIVANVRKYLDMLKSMSRGGMLVLCGLIIESSIIP